MGRVAGSDCVRGWIKVIPGGGVAEALVAAREWWIGEQRYDVAEARAHSATVIGKLAGVETREQALSLKGARVAVERAALGEPGEGHHILADLVGLEVRNEQGELLGTVKRWFSNGAQDVMEVAGERGPLVPWGGGVGKAGGVGGGGPVGGSSAGGG